MSELPQNTLSLSQKRIIAAGVTAFALALLITISFGLFVILQQFIQTFKDVLLPLAIAAILATLLRPTEVETIPMLQEFFAAGTLVDCHG